MLRKEFKNTKNKLHIGKLKFLPPSILSCIFKPFVKDNSGITLHSVWDGTYWNVHQPDARKNISKGMNKIKRNLKEYISIQIKQIGQNLGLITNYGTFEAD